MEYKRDQWCERCHRWHLFIEMCRYCGTQCIGCCATVGADRLSREPHDHPGIWDQAKDFNYDRLNYPVGEYPGDKA
jgi:hypothetical protein